MAGDKIQATATFSENVTVTGTPTLELAIGDYDRIANYTSTGSTATALVFEYTVVSGDADTDGISIEEYKLLVPNEGDSIKDVNDNKVPLGGYTALDDQSGHKVDTTKPKVSSVSITSTGTNNYYKKDDKIQVQVTFSENVTVDTTNGTPQVTLKVGTADKTAGYASGSNSKNLVFEYTVASGDTDGDGIEIEKDKLALNSGTIKDAGGNDATLTHDALAAQSSHRVDTTAPTVSSVALTSAAKTYKKDDKIQATVTFSEDMKVTGTPQLTLKIGTENKTADYKSGSDSEELVFEYTVASGDTDTDGIEIEASKLENANSSTITDYAGNAATLTHTAVAANSLYKVDTTAPTVSSVTITSSAGDDKTYKKGDKIQVQVTLSENVTVTGTPQVTLKIGSDDKKANYESGSNSKNLVFAYTVAAGDGDTDGISIEANKLALNSGTLKDAGGNAATLTHAAVTASDSHKVDGVVPTVSKVEVTSTATNNYYKKDDTIDITVTFSENVTVSGTPELTLKIGESDKDAEYASGSGTAALVFEYDVTASDEDTDGIGIEANKLSLGDGTVSIKDAADNDATLTHTAVGASASHKVDGSVPTISSVEITSSAGSDHTYVKDNIIDVTVTFSEKVTVDIENGQGPYLTLEIGDEDENANYNSGSGTKALVFRYTVADGDNDTDGISIEANQLKGNGSSIKDKGGNIATITYTALDDQSNHKVDTSAATVSSVKITSDPGGDNTYKAGDKIRATVTFGENVTVTGTPQVTLTVGSSDKTAAYKASITPKNLAFEYTVAAGDNDTDGVSIAEDSLSLNSGTIEDSGGNDADLDHDALDDQSDHKVDTTKPTISSGGIEITSTPAHDKTYKLGDTLQVTATFSENVTVTNTPYLGVTINQALSYFPYKSGSGTTKLVFEWTVTSVDTDANGISIPASSFTLTVGQNTASIQDAAGNDATLTFTALTDNSNHKIDVTKPTVSSIAVTSTPTATNTYVAGDKIQVTVTFSEKMRADTTDGTPKVTLVVGSDEKDAEYASGTGTTALVFEYTVVSGDVDTDGVKVKANTLDPNSGALTDLPGNPATVTHAEFAAGSTHTVDATVPTVSSVRISSTADANNYYNVGSKIQVTVTFSEAVAVTGTPQVTLKIGNSNEDAEYASGTGTTALVFEYTVANGDADTDGVEIEKNKLSPNGGTIKDTIGNAANLKHAALAPQTSHKVDGGIPHIETNGITITSTPSTNGYYKTGEKIQVTVEFSEAMAVTGVPQLTLKIGSANRAANYKTGTGTVSLVFEYTVAAGDEDTDGIGIAANQLSLNGGTITDASASNNARLTHAALTTQADHKVDTVAPTIGANGLRITSTPTSYNTYKENNIVKATITFSEDVNVSGTPRLTLKIGSDDKIATYTGYAKDSGNTDVKTSLVFEYTVASGDEDTDGIGIEANKLTLPDGTTTIKDAGGNDATLTHAILTAQADHKVDAIVPTVKKNGLTITSSGGADDIYAAGDDIEITVTFTEKMTVDTGGGNNKPRLTLKIGSKDKIAVWTGGSGTESLVFEYTVLEGDEDTDGISIEADKLALNKAVLTDLAGNPAAVSSTSPLMVKHEPLTAQIYHKVSAIRPKIKTDGIAITSSSGNNYYNQGATLQVTATFDETVTVTGTPTLGVTIGTSNKTARYTTGSGTASLVFEYTIVSGDEDTDGVSIAANQLSFNGGTIRDAEGNAANVMHLALGTQASHKVDGIVPTVATDGIAITSMPTSDHTYKNTETIQATVTFSEKVAVTNTPRLKLRIGTSDKAADYKRGTGTKYLVFEYTVAPGDTDTDGIEIHANKLSLNDGTIADVGGNPATLTHDALTTQTTHKVNSGSGPQLSPLKVDSVNLSSTGPYGTGDNIEVTVSTSEAIIVTGVPTITLVVGTTDRTAQYARGSGSADLVFSYTVVADEQDDNGVAVTASSLALNGGTLKNSSDSALALTHSGITDGGTPHSVDTTKPTVSKVAITSSPNNGSTYIKGEIIRATVTFSESVKVTGTPQLTLNIGDAKKKANYASGTGTAALIFDYTVAVGDTDTDGISIDANKLALNNGTIKDPAGNPATLTHDAVSASAQGMAFAQGASGAGGFAMAMGQAQSQSTEHKVDGVSPSITTGGVKITSTPTNNYYTTDNTNNTIQVQVAFDEDVKVVSGAPQLTLRIGSTNKNASYEGYGKKTDDNTQEDKTKLVFEYTVVAGDNDPNGISIQSLSGNIEDDAGNPANLTGVSLTDQPSHKVDTGAPSIRGIEITSTPGSESTYRAGETIQAKVTFSESVTVDTTNGIPALNLKIGTRYQPARYASGTGTPQLFFGYTVLSTDTDSNGISIDMNQLDLNDGTIKDGANNAAILTNTSLGTQTAHKVGQAANSPGGPDTRSPEVTSVSLTSTGPYGVWSNITVQVSTTEAVTVTGSPSLAIVIGNKEKRASYQSGSGSASLVFQYTVSSADGDDPNGISVKANSLSSGTIKDTSDNTLDPNHPALTDQGPTQQVDTTAPQVSSVAFTSTGPYTVGSTVQVTVTTSEAVTVTGSPSVTLVIGSTERTANYLSGTGSTALVFRYTVTTADKDDTNGISLKTNSLKTNGGTILDTAGNALKLTHGSVSNGGEAQAVGVTVSGISSVAFTSTGPYAVKDVVKITVTAAENVTVTGIPRVAMVIGEALKYANYISGTGTTALVFHYTVVAGDSDPDGIEIPQNALEHYNGSTIKNHYQTALNLSHAGVAADTNHTVDTAQPLITSVAFASDAPTVYTAGSTIEVIVTFAETGVKVTSDESGALPSLSLLFGANADPDSRKTAVQASYTEARPGSTKLVFAYTVTAETPIDTDGVQIQARSLRIPTGASIEDTSGNAIAATPSGDGSQIVGIKPASRLTSRPILPSVTSAGIVFNEFFNATTDKHDWVELRNTTDTEVSLGGWKLSLSGGNRTQTETLEFPDMTVPAGTVLLLLNTGHKETHLENSQAYTYRYFKMPKLRLRGSNFSLMLRDRSGAIVDVVSNDTAASGTATGFERDTAYFREQPTTPGYEVSAWQPSGYQGGLGYDRQAPKARSLGTPGYPRSALTPQAQPMVNISEIMFTTGLSGKLPQWIELYNPSKTEVVTLQGWRLQVEIYDPSRQPGHHFVTLMFHKTLRILPNQTVLVVTKNGRNSQHFPEHRVYNFKEQNAEKLQQFGLTTEFLNDLGYAIVLRDESGTQIDIAGNLDGESNTSDVPNWKLPNCITSVGYRTSIIRQYEKGAPLTGTHKSSWFRATEMRRQIVTYYGHPKDLGNPGWKKGGPLPVQLSSFKAERTEQGALLQWTTASELENAGFNVLRSETKAGPFQVVTPRMLQGAGTTSERSTYTYVDTTAKENVAYYYRLEEVSFSGVQQPVATRRLRGHVSAANRYLTTFGTLKKATW